MRPTPYDTVLGILLGLAIGLALSAFFATFAYRPPVSYVRKHDGISVQYANDTMYYTYIPELEVK